MTKWLTMHEAYAIQLNETPLIVALKPAKCEVCGSVEECRTWVCFKCMDKIEIDMEKRVVREKENHAHVWLYQWHCAEFDL